MAIRARHHDELPDQEPPSRITTPGYCQTRVRTAAAPPRRAIASSMMRPVTRGRSASISRGHDESQTRPGRQPAAGTGGRAPGSSARDRVDPALELFLVQFFLQTWSFPFKPGSIARFARSAHNPGGRPTRYHRDARPACSRAQRAADLFSTSVWMFPEAPVEAVLPHQSLRASRSARPGRSLEDHDPVGVHQGRQAMRDDDRRLTPAAPRRASRIIALRVGVDRAQRVVEHQDRTDRRAAPAPARPAAAARRRGSPRVPPRGCRTPARSRRSSRARRPWPPLPVISFSRAASASQPDVLADRLRVEKRLLHHDRDLRPDRLPGKLRDVALRRSLILPASGS